MFGTRNIDRRRALSLVEAILPPSGELEDLVTNFAAHRGCPVHVLPLDLGPASLSGLWISTDDSDYIAYARNASPERACAIVCHEIGHALLGHQHLDLADQVLASGHFTALSPDLVRATLAARHGYATPEEQDAELVGTHLSAGLRRRLERGGNLYTDERWN